MKKVILEIKHDVFALNEQSISRGNLLFAYKSQNSTGYAVLIKVQDGFDIKYGFAPLNNSESNLRFTASTKLECIKAALKANRDVFVFESQDELLKAMFKRYF